MSTASAYSTSPLDETRRSQDLIHGPPVPERPAELSLGNISTPLFPSTLPNPNSNRSNLFPPAYHSIATPSASAIQASQASRNLEKQALRDAWREQAESLVHVPRGQVPRTTGPPSVEPSSDSNSSGENRERVGLGINGAELSPVLSNLSGPAQQKGFRHRGILPKGMDVREALAKCEDPALGWSLQFWVTIADPSTQHVFFACPASGQCSWDPPVGAFVVPRSPMGEWWELADTTRSNRSYYYNTLTRRTQWTRPGGDAFVIPLGLIQSSALPSRHAGPSRTSARHSSVPNNSHLTPNAAMTTPPRNRERTSSFPTPTQSPRGPNPRPPLTPRTPSGQRISLPQPLASPSPVHFPQAYPTGTPPPMETESTYFPLVGVPFAEIADAEAQYSALSALNTSRSRSPNHDRNSPSDSNDLASQSTSGSNAVWRPLSVVDEGSVHETEGGDGGGAWWERRFSKPILPKNFDSPKGKGNALQEDEEGGMAAAGGAPLAQVQSGSSRRQENDVQRVPFFTDPSILFKHDPPEPIFVESSMRSTRLSTGWHPVLAPEISGEIQNFQMDAFADKHFTKRRGVLRLRVPVERIMEWQKSPITSPLLNLPKGLAKDALTIFKVIQHIMGERNRPVENARPMQSSSSSLPLGSLDVDGRRDDGYLQRNGRLATGSSNGGENGNQGKTEKLEILEEVRWMIQVGVAGNEMRDETYTQLVKQLTKNPDHDAMVLGFQLLCVLVNAFGPSGEFATFVASFLQRNLEDKADGIGVMAKCQSSLIWTDRESRADGVSGVDCLTKLDVLATKGGRGKVLTVGEIEHASDAAFYPSVYGESLERIMQLQASSYPNLKVPVVLPFLADGILALGGTQSEGIFRVPADTDSVSELKSRIDRGHYQFQGIDDPHVGASLFKLWMRELDEPLVPSELYNEALAASKVTQQAIDFIHLLPNLNRRVLLFVISFFQQFMREEVMEVTKMTAQNLALVLAPNILRTTSDHLETVFTNSSFESKFVLQLLENLRPREVDPDYIPTHGPEMESGRTDRGYHREV